jgi:8-oxo-dGTP pyrophosphatase MutT (NUDIX family)
MERPGYLGAGFIPLSPDGRSVLLVTDARSNKQGFPKGHRESVDTSDLHTAVRECREEIGWEPSDYTVYEEPFRLTKGSSSYIFRYIVAKEDARPPVGRPGEISDAVWKPIASLLHEGAEGADGKEGNKYLRAWIADLKNKDIVRKSAMLYLLLTKPPCEPVRPSHVVARA